MNFELDQQTIRDLELFNKKTPTKSIFSIFDKAITKGGQDYLYNLMKSPLSNYEKLVERRDCIKFFCDTNFSLKIDPDQFDFIEYYLKSNSPILGQNLINGVFQNISYKLKPTNSYYIIQTGIKQLSILFLDLLKELKKIDRKNVPNPIKEDITYIKHFLSDTSINKFYSPRDKFDLNRINKYDFLIRREHKSDIRKILDILYRFDAFISISKTAENKSFVFPDYLSSSKPIVEISSLYHPLVKNAKPYNINIDKTNLCFLTGPNMAGKSTFLKSLGITIYLAHLGFPVPALSMKTTIYKGISTTINLADDINKGYSHFYSEVKRIKETALKLKEKGSLFVIFDELFRGTNVKDAFDASLLVIQSFAKIKSCSFFVSTHITEIANELGNINNISFKYFDSKLIDNKPAYNYELLDGISHERLGMLIVKNENIIEILDSISDK